MKLILVDFYLVIAKVDSQTTKFSSYIMVISIPCRDDGRDKGRSWYVGDLVLQVRGGTGGGMTVAASSSGVAILPMKWFKQ